MATRRPAGSDLPPVTRGRVVLGAVLGALVYVVVLVGGSAVAAAVTAATREVAPMWWVPVVPAVLAGSVGPLVAGAARLARLVDGVLVAVPAAVVAAATTWWGNVLAAQHGGPPAAEGVLDVVLQPVGVLVVAAATVLLLRRRTARGPGLDAH